MSYTRKTATLSLLIVLIGGALGWFALTAGGSHGDLQPALGPAAGDAVEAPRPVASDPAPERTELVDAGGGEVYVSHGETTVIHPLELSLTLLSRKDVPRAEGVPELGTGADARLRGVVRGPSDEGLAATVRFVAGPNAGRELQADSTGAFGAYDLYPGLAIVRIEAAPDYVAEREVLLGSRAAAQLNVGFGLLSTVYGEVVDERGEPIGAVEVRVDGREAHTDAEGIFHVQRVASGKVLALFEKQGYARYRQTLGIQAGRTIPQGRLKFVLREAAALELTIDGDVGHRTAPATVLIHPVGAGQVDRTRGERTYPWHTIGALALEPGVTRRVDDLPEGHVLVTVFRPGAVGDPQQTMKRLWPGRTEQLVLRLQPAPQVRGRVVRAGKPVPGVRVTMEAPDRQKATERSLSRNSGVGQELLLAHGGAGVQRLETDSLGRFQFSRYDEVTKGYYLAAETSDGLWQASAVVTAGDGELELELQRVREATGALRLGLPARFQGLPVRVRVHGAPRDPFVVPPDQDEVLVDGLEEGSWRLTVGWDGEVLLDGASVSIEEGEEPRLAVSLPAGAIDGQSPEERARAGF